MSNKHLHKWSTEGTIGPIRPIRVYIQGLLFKLQAKHGVLSICSLFCKTDFCYEVSFAYTRLHLAVSQPGVMISMVVALISKEQSKPGILHGHSCSYA